MLAALLIGLHSKLHELHSKRSKSGGMVDVVEKARARVAVLMRKKSLENFTNYLIGVDGSPEADNALEVVLEELVKGKDGVIALHCYDNSASEKGKPIGCRASSKLKEKTEIELMTRTFNSRYALKWHDRQGQPVAKFILKVVNKMCLERDALPQKEKPSYFTIGIAPRQKITRMDLALVAAGEFELPTIIIKQGPIIDRSRIFVAAIKDLVHLGPYTTALELMKPGNGDICLVIHVHTHVKFLLFLELSRKP